MIIYHGLYEVRGMRIHLLCPHTEEEGQNVCGVDHGLIVSVRVNVTLSCFTISHELAVRCLVPYLFRQVILKVYSMSIHLSVQQQKS